MCSRICETTLWTGINKSCGSGQVHTHYVQGATCFHRDECIAQVALDSCLVFSVMVMELNNHFIVSKFFNICKPWLPQIQIEKMTLSFSRSCYGDEI